MITKERIEKSELFAGLTEESLQALAEICEPETGAKGTLLCQDGAVAEKLYILEEGKVMIKFKSGFSFDISVPGQILGWSALINPHRFKADAICEEDSKLIRIKSSDFFDLCRKHRDLGFVVMNNLSGIIFRRLQDFAEYY
jgi:signal-transduction protein with cAMP-binding, CBS, and nucleotidyltransferase domain